MTEEKMRGSAEPLPGKCGALLKGCMRREGMNRYCTRPAGWGTDHAGIGACKLHGGSTTTHVVAAERTKAKLGAIEMLREMGEPAPLGNPVDELLDAAALVVQWKDICMVKVAELGSFDVAASATRPEQIKAVIELFERSMDRVISTLVQLEKLNLMDRKLALDEEQGTFLAEWVLKVILNPRLTLSDAQIDIARVLLNDSMPEIAPILERKTGHDVIYAELVEDDD